MHDGAWEEVRRSTPSDKPKARGKARTGERGREGKGAGKRRGKCKTGKSLQEEPDYFPYKCHRCGKKGHKAAQRGKEIGKGRGKEGNDGADEGDVEDASAASAQDIGDLDLRAVEGIWEDGAGQIGANIPEELPPSLVDLDKFNPWARYLDPESRFDPW